MSGNHAAPQPPPETGSFEERLQAARKRQGLDQPEVKGTPAGKPMSNMGVGLRVGVELVAALAVALGIGWGLDYWLGTKPLFLALFVPVGGAAGILNVWRLVAPRG